MDYRVHLQQFDGPLDLLLHLIEESKLDINDIFISEITSQYLSYMEELESIDMDTASEFLAMAANLLYIKSRQLLPRPPREEETEQGEEDPAEVLMRQLREYKAFKAVSKELEDVLQKAGELRTRLPEDVPLPPQRFQIEGISQEGLYAAFLSILKRTEGKEELIELHDVHQDTFTIRSCLKSIRSLLRVRKEEVPFEDLFPERAEKMHVIVTFMTLLEMINHGEVRLRQKGPFAAIFVSMAELKTDTREDETVYMDEEMD